MPLRSFIGFSRRAIGHLFVVAIVVALASACAKRPRVQFPGAANTPGVSANTVVDGTASYYGDPYHGRRTASGETFDKNKMTAAHRTLPFNTWVRVRNQLNGKAVDVRINDRGPFVDGRVIDLSEGAARRIDMLRAGVVPVSLEVIRERYSQSVEGERRRNETETPSNVFYVVQLGAFRNPALAEDLRRRYASKYSGIYVDPPGEGSPFYKVRIGRPLLGEARYLQDLLKREDNVNSIVVRME